MAKDSAHEFSDAEIRAFEREVAGVYGEASKAAYANLKRYLAQFETDDEKMRERLEAGEITKAQYRSWRSGKIAAGRRYRIVLKQCAETMTHANVAAAAAIEGRLPEVYAENYNYGTWQVESAVGWDTAYALQDASTVQRLLTDHDSYLPKPSVNVAKDVAWNRRLIANQITQGVLLGESIPKIAKRMQDVTGANRAAAVRLARTSTTAAENAGRVDSYKRAKGLGINVQQEWVATLDGRTRKRHRQLDREKVDVGEKFSNGCRYPGDPEAPYAETCNCRCTLIACCDGLDVLDGERFSRLPEGMTYEEWKAGKPAVTGARPADRTISEFMDMPGTKRKLDVAGVSPTEARKKLTEQLKEYGIPSGSFRKMSAGDQQKVLDTALARISHRTGRPDLGAEVYKNLTKGQKADISRFVKKADKRASSAYLKNEARFRLIDHDYGGTGCFVSQFEDSGKIGVMMGVSKDFSDDAVFGKGKVWFHEFGHYVDYLSTGSGCASLKMKKGLDSTSMWFSSSYRDGAFGKTLRKEAEGYIADRGAALRRGLEKAVVERDAKWLKKNTSGLTFSVASDLHELSRFREHLGDRAWLAENGAPYLGRYDRQGPQEWYDHLFDKWVGGHDFAISDDLVCKRVADEITALGVKAGADVSDIFSGVTDNRCKDGVWHPGYDWNDDSIAREAFAEFFSASFTSPESAEQLRRYFPESGKIFDEMLDELGRG